MIHWTALEASLVFYRFDVCTSHWLHDETCSALLYSAQVLRFVFMWDLPGDCDFGLVIKSRINYPVVCLFHAHGVDSLVALTWLPVEFIIVRCAVGKMSSSQALPLFSFERLCLQTHCVPTPVFCLRPMMSHRLASILSSINSIVFSLPPLCAKSAVSWWYSLIDTGDWLIAIIKVINQDNKCCKFMFCDDLMSERRYFLAIPQTYRHHCLSIMVDGIIFWQ